MVGAFSQVKLPPWHHLLGLFLLLKGTLRPIHNGVPPWSLVSSEYRHSQGTLVISYLLEHSRDETGSTVISRDSGREW